MLSPFDQYEASFQSINLTFDVNGDENIQRSDFISRLRLSHEQLSYCKLKISLVGLFLRETVLFKGNSKHKGDSVSSFLAQTVRIPLGQWNFW